MHAPVNKPMYLFQLQLSSYNMGCFKFIGLSSSEDKKLTYKNAFDLQYWSYYLRITA